MGLGVKNYFRNHSLEFVFLLFRYIYIFVLCYENASAKKGSYNFVYGDCWNILYNWKYIERRILALHADLSCRFKRYLLTGASSSGANFRRLWSHLAQLDVQSSVFGFLDILLLGSP